MLLLMCKTTLSNVHFSPQCPFIWWFSWLLTFSKISIDGKIKRKTRETGMFCSVLDLQVISYMKEGNAGDFNYKCIKKCTYGTTKWKARITIQESSSLASLLLLFLHHLGKDTLSRTLMWTGWEEESGYVAVSQQESFWTVKFHVIYGCTRGRNALALCAARREE